MISMFEYTPIQEYSKYLKRFESVATASVPLVLMLKFCENKYSPKVGRLREELHIFIYGFL